MFCIGIGNIVGPTHTGTVYHTYRICPQFTIDILPGGSIEVVVLKGMRNRLEHAQSLDQEFESLVKKLRHTRAVFNVAWH